MFSFIVIHRLFIVIIFLSIFPNYVFAHTTSYQLNICNYAPYPVETTIRKNVPYNEFSVVKKVIVKAGKCEEQIFDEEYIQPELVLHSRASDSIPYKELSKRTWYNATWEAGFAGWGGDGEGPIFCGAKNNLSQQRHVRSESECKEFEVPFFYTSAIKFDHANVKTWATLDYSVCERIKSFSCYNIGYADLSFWATDLAVSLNFSFQAKFPEHRLVREPIATNTGFEVLDKKGTFDRGVLIEPLREFTPFGSAIPIKSGDVLISFNDVPIFNVSALIYAVYEHAIYRGIDESFKMVIKRNNEYYNIESGVYFDDLRYKKWFEPSSKCDVLSFGFSALEEASFYTEKFLGCELDQLTSKNYSSSKKCRYVRTHIAAIYKQFCPDTNFWGSWIGGWYVPFKGHIEKMFAKSAFKGGKTVSKLLRTALFEGSEEALRSFITIPVGIDVDTTLDQMLNGAKWGAGIGIAFELAAPMILRR